MLECFEGYILTAHLVRAAEPLEKIMKKRVGLKIYGRVQGVFFRDSSQRKAKELNLTGWVRNVPDGTVQIVAEGEEKDLKELIEWCRAGGLEYARVDEVNVEWTEPSGQFNDFMVK